MDAKGRMAIPARYRDGLISEHKGCLVATIDIENACLFIYPQSEWEEIEAKIGRMSTFKKEARLLQHLLIGHARELELDSNGRVLVPPELRAYAKLDKKVTLVGQSHRFELWSQANWNAKRDALLSEVAGEFVISDEFKSLSL